jgi:hypothetical protein
MPAFAPGATFLGASTPLAAQGTDTPVVSFPAGYGMLFVYFYIAGYSNTGVAILRTGSTAGSVDTGTNYSIFTSHWITTATVQTSNARASQTGLWVANDATTNGRRGIATIWNPSTAPSTCIIDTVTYGVQNPTTAASTLSTQSRSVGSWFSNAQAVSIRLNAGTGSNLTSGSFISVYGIPGTS